MSKETQKAYLTTVKKALEERYGRLTWDELATRAGIEARTLKAYRMPESSADYRPMPTLARQAIDALMSQPASSQKDVHMLVSALAALVVAQAKISLLDRQIISGMDWRPGARSGLSVEDRKIMALVSRFSLQAGLPDFGGEIHELLLNCTKPLELWLKIPALLDAGYGSTVLIDPDYGVPTPEAQEMASAFSTITAHLEERLFAALKETLGKYPASSANAYYTAIREFIVRNPVVDTETLFQASKLMPGSLWMAVQNDYYEPVPYALASDGMITLCTRCRSMMKPTGAKSGAMRCQSRACHISFPATPGKQLEIQDARRVKRGIHQYWVEPGIDEIRLYDALVGAGLPAELYPFQDRVDIALGDIGMDLKTYVSPEILGAKFRKGIGGLNHYGTKWLIIPDWLIASGHAYLSRLTDSMGDNAKRVQCLALSEAFKLAKAAHKNEGTHA